MKYYISHITNTQTHESLFTLDSNGNRIMPYTLVASRAYVMDTGEPITDGKGYIHIPKTRSSTDLQSVALIACHDDYTAVEGQTLYGIDELHKCINEHPELDYSLLGQAWINGELIPNKDFIS